MPYLAEPGRARRTLLSLLALAGGLAATPQAAPAPRQQALDSSWYDGQAEVCGYRWSGSRYGEERTGEAVAIFVTEPFSEGLHVKADEATGTPGDVITALKLNLVRDFQTGIYDYNTMTSVFVKAHDLELMKSTFSSAEWCGHVFEEIDVRAGVPTLTTRSYFQGESGVTSLPGEPGGIVGEQLFIWLRGLHGAPLAPGESTRVPFVRGSFERRMRHRGAAWKWIEVERDANPVTLSVPAGTFEAITYRAQVQDVQGAPARGSAVVQIEAAAPHRLLAWSWTVGSGFSDSGELTGSKRLKYWELHGEGQEELRASIGLPGR